jgi:acyl carrier protein
MIGMDKKHWSNHILVLASILFLLAQPSCHSKSTSQTTGTEFSQGEIVSKVRQIVARKLEVDPNTIDVDTSISKQKIPADELDAVEIILEVENAFQIEIKEEEVGGSSQGLADRLSVRRLSEIVEQKKAAK